MAETKIMVFGIRHCYIVYNNAGALAFKRAWFNKESELKVSSTKLEFSGDGQKIARDYGYQASGTVAFAVDDDMIDTILWPITATTPAGADGFATALYHGTDLELQANYLGLYLTLDAQNADTGAPLAIRFNVFKCMFDPEQPVKYATEAVGGRLLSFNAYRATTDIVGNALTGIPSRGAFWRKEIITNTSNFDPVPGAIL